MQKVGIGIVGAAGYTGSELLRLAVNHPLIEIKWALSTALEGKQVVEHLPDLLGFTNLKFEKTAPSFNEIACIFLCVAHGAAKDWLAENSVPEGVKLIDLSQDFRSAPESGFVYGLTELNKAEISKAEKVANPGCFATCIQLALLPALDYITSETKVHITAITGSTGAGQKPEATTHFSWRSNNVSLYKVFEHQHEKEIAFNLFRNRPPEIFFTPIRGPFARGILAHIYFEPWGFDPQEVIESYQTKFQASPMVHHVDFEPDLKQVVGTNNCLINARVVKNQVSVVAVLDNLLKGASGQALENFNLMQGWPATMGLQLKASGW